MTIAVAHETDEEQRHRLLGLAEQAAAELVCILRAHLYHHSRPPSLGLRLAIQHTQATLMALSAILPDGPLAMTPEGFYGPC